MAFVLRLKSIRKQLAGSFLPLSVCAVVLFFGSDNHEPENELPSPTAAANVCTTAVLDNSTDGGAEAGSSHRAGISQAEPSAKTTCVDRVCEVSSSSTRPCWEACASSKRRMLNIQKLNEVDVSGAEFASVAANLAIGLSGGKRIRGIEMFMIHKIRNVQCNEQFQQTVNSYHESGRNANVQLGWMPCALDDLSSVLNGSYSSATSHSLLNLSTLDHCACLVGKSLFVFFALTIAHSLAKVCQHKQHLVFFRRRCRQVRTGC